MLLQFGRKHQLYWKWSQTKDLIKTVCFSPIPMLRNAKEREKKNASWKQNTGFETGIITNVRIIQRITQLSIITWPQSCTAYENRIAFKHIYFFHSAVSIPCENDIKGRIWVMSQPTLSKEITLTLKNHPCKNHWLLSLLTNSGNSDIPSIWVLFKSYPAISRIVGPRSIFATSICRMRRT